MNNETEGIVCVVVIFAALIIGTLIYAVFIKSDNNIPPGEQKPKEQVTTEVNTHVIRCTTYVNDTCTEYKVYKVVKE